MTCEALLALPGVVQELEVVVEEKKGEASHQTWNILQLYLNIFVYI